MVLKIIRKVCLSITGLILSLGISGWSQVYASGSNQQSDQQLVQHSEEHSNEHANEHNDSYDYPELSVVPRASARLQSEAQREADREWTNFLPIQLSGLATLAAGVAAFDPSDPSAGHLGIGIGAGWLVLTGVLSVTYEPYRSAYRYDVGPMPKGTIREQLAREREAEEDIKSIAAMGERLKWLSVVTNLGTSIYMIAKSGSNSNSCVNCPNSSTTSSANTTAQGFGIASAAISLFPLIFRFHWHDVAESQMDYKKRIFAPVANVTFFHDPMTGKEVPGMALSLRF